MSHRQRGFALIEAIIIVAFVAVLAFVGWKTWPQKPAAKNAPQTSSSKLVAPSAFKPESNLPDFASIQVPAKPSSSTANPNLPGSAKAQSTLKGLIKPDETQGVRMNDGTIYFGKLSESEPGSLRLIDVYTLKSSPCNPVVSGKVCVSMMRGAVDPLPLKTADVAVWENLPPDNLFVDAINTYERSSNASR